MHDVLRQQNNQVYLHAAGHTCKFFPTGEAQEAAKVCVLTCLIAHFSSAGASTEQHKAWIPDVIVCIPTVLDDLPNFLNRPQKLFQESTCGRVRGPEP